MIAMTFRRLAVIVALGLSGCVSKSSGGSAPNADFDASFEDVRFGPSDSGQTSDAAASSCLAPTADGACNSVQNVAAPVMGVCETGAQPEGAGGGIVDGTYALTAQSLYSSSACNAGTFQATMIIAGSCIERVDIQGGTDLRRNMVITTTGNALTRSATCGTTLPSATYTATATQLTIFDQGGAVTVWTKQ
jgi:hypothetical protein